MTDNNTSRARGTIGFAIMLAPFIIPNALFRGIFMGLEWLIVKAWLMVFRKPSQGPENTP